MADNRILILVGPTAVGKSKVAMELAFRLGGEIVVADSMQVYRGMDIGTAKPGMQERKAIPHHMIDLVSIFEYFSAGDYAMLAERSITEIIKRGRLPIICGGTGLYIRALVDGLFNGPPACRELRSSLRKIAKRWGIRFLWDYLNKVDPEYADVVSPNDLVRIIRGIEVYRLTAKPMSQHFKEQGKDSYKDSTLRCSAIPVFIGIKRERRELYFLINRRVGVMFAEGFMREVIRLRKAGLSEEYPSGKALGYRQLLQFLDDKISFADTLRIIRRETRHYAKRQLCWFGADKRIRWYDITGNFNWGEIATMIIKTLHI